MKRLVIGILAHVDSGKTTLSEAMLYCGGGIRKLGRVDHRDAFLDTHEIERDRGITIFSKQAVLSLKNTEITFLDTPGHTDFSTETERTLQVLDYAILVIDGSEGVRGHTESLWRHLARYGIPVFVFINKTDISEKSRDELIKETADRLGGNFTDFTEPEKSEEFFENAAVCSDFLMQKFLDGEEISDKDIARAILSRKIFPCYFGSALKLDGVEEFLGGLERYTEEIKYGDEFGARVFKISEDERGNRLTYMKITGGSLKVKDLLNVGKSGEIQSEKVNELRIYSGAKYRCENEVCAGIICAATGLTKTYPGEGLGAEEDLGIPMTEAILNYRIDITDGTDIHTAISNLRRLEEEEPQLKILWNEQIREIHAQLMGEIQTEVLKRLISERFNMSVDFVRGGIAYKETVAAPVEGVGHYEPLRHYAEVHVIIEPLERGSGIRFASSCSEDDLAGNWQRLIMTHLREKTHIGVLTGSPVTDVRITLSAGRAHLKHTEGGDFRQATYRAVRQGLMSAKSILLEPWCKFRLEVPSETVGRAMNDIGYMCGKFEPPLTEGEMSVIVGRAPAINIREYHREVTRYTSGRGRLSVEPDGYEECHNSDEVTANIGYNSEADTENTADSVFCSHGAGFNVKWDEVPKYMHLESTLEKNDGGGKIRNGISMQSVRDYMERTVNDEELLRIFENTYGPVKRRTHTAVRERKESVRTEKTKAAAEGPEYLLVDGYNIIFAWEDLKKTAKESLEAARNELISRLRNYQGFKQCELILVFDAYKVKNNPGEQEKQGNITVVYTKEAETADMYIEKVTHRIGRKHRVRVATSDSLEQLIILAGGAYRMSADMLREEVESVENAIREFIRKDR
ncbi:MAG: TetM/TetW/TetO/TetS family tetracycline resistance ribosomal protection protein [Oscillospiraceae bacterium]|nr:TetM/TetW/TetO/TetS family tetracycline resistance ribosomal protection protein [Oscillospiraceae bacterium]